MGNRLNGASIFSGYNAGLNNTFTQLANAYGDKLTLENLSKSLTDTKIINGAYGNTFASYLTSNFNNIDSDKDGVLSAEEVQKLMNNITTQGLTREQITALGTSSGMSTSLMETVLNHFDEIDKNHDGKVTNQEIQAYGVDSDVQERKTADTNRLVSNMSMFYETDNKYEGSLLDYKLVSNDNKSKQ